jgi:hypothetical protein
MRSTTPSPQEEACDEVAEGIGEYFGQLAQVTVAKSDTINTHVVTIPVLSKTITNLTATNKILVTALAAKGTRAVNPSPSFTPTDPATANTTGHMVNSHHKPNSGINIFGHPVSEIRH